MSFVASAPGDDCPWHVDPNELNDRRRNALAAWKPVIGARELSRTRRPMPRGFRAHSCSAATPSRDRGLCAGTRRKGSFPLPCEASRSASTTSFRSAGPSARAIRSSPLPGGETVADGEWVLAIFEIGERKRATAAAARGVDKGDGTVCLTFERRDWERTARRSPRRRARRSRRQTPPGGSLVRTTRSPVSVHAPPLSEHPICVHREHADERQRRSPRRPPVPSARRRRETATLAARRAPRRSHMLRRRRAACPPR